MNYLAHLLLADDDAESIIGNLAADFTSGEEAQGFPPRVVAGIQRHHAVDDFTDSHPAFLASRRRIDPQFRHYSGIIADVFYDHFLTAHWAEYSARPLDGFVADIHQLLAAHTALCPAAMREVLPRMIGENWLGSYATVDGIATTLTRISQRTRRKAPLGLAAADLQAQYAAFDADFLEFFPQLVRHVRG